MDFWSFGDDTCIIWLHENSNLLAEFEQYLFKYKHWSCAAQNGEGLPSKQGIRYSSKRCSKQ